MIYKNYIIDIFLFIHIILIYMLESNGTNSTNDIYFIYVT